MKKLYVLCLVLGFTTSNAWWETHPLTKEEFETARMLVERRIKISKFHELFLAAGKQEYIKNYKVCLKECLSDYKKLIRTMDVYDEFAKFTLMR